MINYILDLLNWEGFMPHGHCYLWQPAVLWTHVISDALIFSAYLSIPITLGVLIRRRKDIAFSWVFVLFGVFIVACGINHAMNIVTVWIPAYRLDGMLKLVTAMASVGTALTLWPLVPRVVALPSPAQLDEMNRKLAAEIEEHKRTEQALRESEIRFRSVAESANDGLIAANSLGHIISWNKAAGRIFGYEEAEVVGRPLTLLMPDRYRAAHASSLAQQAQAGKSKMLGKTLELIGLRKDGREFPLELSVASWKVRAEIFYSGIVRDITQRKRVDDALRMSNERFQFISRATNDAVWDYDVITGLQWWSGGVRSIFGYHPEEIGNTYQSWTTRVHPDDLGRVTEQIHQTIESGEQSWTQEYRFRRADKTYAVVCDRGYLVRSTEGKLVRMLGSMMDITERRQMEEDLRANEKQLAEAQRIAHIGSWSWDVTSNKITWSDELYRIFGIQPQEFGATYEAYFSYVHPEDRELVRNMIERALREKSFPEYDNRIIRPDGSVRVVQAKGIVISNSDGVPVRMNGTTQDVTERKQMEAELKQASNQALQSAQLKSDFLANMSHEIRTPLNGVIGMIDLLLTTQLTSKQRHYAETVHRSGESLLMIINDILDFSKIEAGKMQLETIQFDVQALLDDVASTLAESAHSKNIELAVSVDPSMTTILQGDPLRLIQVLTNLVSNAIKFTERGEVVIRATCPREFGRNVSVRFEVSDTGTGIPRDQQGRLFQAFSQADSSTTRRYGGTGLGLAICARLVKLMGGEIGVQSELNKGSLFWFTVQLTRESTGFYERLPMRPDISGCRVLIVDDNATNRFILLEQLNSWGVLSGSANDAADALRLMHDAVDRGEPYDLVILDMQMPGMDGLTLARTIKANAQIAAAPLVLLTSMSRDLNEEAGETGIAASLTKPARMSDLYDCLVKMLVAAPSEGAPDLRPNAAPSLSTVVSHTRILVAEDNIVNQQVIEGILKVRGYCIDLVGNGHEAVEAVARTSYAAVLMDCQMPEMDGYAASMEIRKRETAAGRTPIIALTAHALAGEREKCLAAGMDDYLTKPIKRSEVYSALERWVPKAASRRGVDISNRRENNAPVSDVVDPKALENLRVLQEPGEPDFVSGIIESYLVDGSQRLASVQDLVARGAAQELTQMAHALKGSSANVGALRMVQLCAQLEALGRSNELTHAGGIVASLEAEFAKVRTVLEVYIAKE
jgi:PAS domain S-box-containing protein